ncbi:hypothetical protein PV328_005256 [Microctonus aethiopoides]|uniref:Uncharacterized protein n=1 Tax=Microctonus aethiopoides TaxID=144406 RepID=A0AA39KS44_9HYME|nr:hypothetical protein PV328_005256 [Microctonus aethiopoides]
MPRPSWLMKNHMSVTVHRQLRALSYPDESEMGLFFALAIPLDDSISTKAISVAFFFEANYQLPKNTENLEKNKKSSKKRSINQNQHLLNRKTIYSILESKLTALGLPGNLCLLKIICEINQNNLHHHNGLVGDLLRILFTPSSSADEENLTCEYIAAEQLANSTDNCNTIYPHCPITIYDYITV